MQTKITIGAQGQVTLEARNGPATAACRLTLRRLLAQLQAAGLALTVEHEESRPPGTLGGPTPLAGASAPGAADAAASAR